MSHIQTKDYMGIFLTGIDVVAFVWYLGFRDWKQAVYWLAAAVLTGTVSLWK
jgi:hypothetical protein